MDFYDIVQDITKLEGLPLSSIRPGANIIIEKVDLEQKKILVRNKTGELKSRPFSEFQRVWEALQSTPTIRVEEVLNGSGSSRNQPETIFANLPYIEWLKITNKKHISFVGKQTHPFGTIKQMDRVDASKIQVNQLVNPDASKLVIINATNKLCDTIRSCSKEFGINPIAVAIGKYKYILPKAILYYIDAAKNNLKNGVYIEWKDNYGDKDLPQIQIDGQSFSICDIGDSHFLFRNK